MGWFGPKTGDCSCCGAVCEQNMDCTSFDTGNLFTLDVTIPAGFTDDVCSDCDELAGGYVLTWDAATATHRYIEMGWSNCVPWGSVALVICGGFNCVLPGPSPPATCSLGVAILLCYDALVEFVQAGCTLPGGQCCWMRWYYQGVGTVPISSLTLDYHSIGFTWPWPKYWCDVNDHPATLSAEVASV